MLHWFGKLSKGRKLLVLWNVLFLPIFIVGGIAFIFFADVPLALGLPVQAGAVVVALIGFLFAWRVAK